jgi:phospholipid-binding lipoprotein MlaA
VQLAASHRGAWRRAAYLLLAALLTGCAAPPRDPAARAAFEQNNDPLEPLNRETLKFNQLLDRILLKPVTEIYIAALPEPARNAIKRALANMKEPVIVINNALQGRPEGAGIAAGRFAVNTTVGLVGFLEVAQNLGLKPQTGDFGQTLYAWGFPQGPYLVLPILGPSNPRDALGMVADNYIDPFSYAATAADADDIQLTRFIVGGVDERARVATELDDLQKNSLDFYAALRSLMQQHRATELRHGAAPPPPSPNFYDVPDKPAAAPAEKPAAGASPPGSSP